VFNTPVKNLQTWLILIKSLEVGVEKGTVGKCSREFFKTLKTEQIYGNKLISKDQMNSIYLNILKFGTTEKRRHSALEYKKH
jgi:hypothetical protein